jgi:hypothetical protein
MSWTNAYAKGDRVEKKIRGDWLPGTVTATTMGVVRGLLDLRDDEGDKIHFVADEPGEIRHAAAAPQGGEAGDKADKNEAKAKPKDG